MRRRATLGMALVCIAAAAAGQTPPAPAGDPRAGDPIVVTGARPEDDPAEVKRLRETIRTGFSAPGYRADMVSAKYAAAERAGKCAARGRIVAPAQLRAVVDGVFNSNTHDIAQDRLIVQTAACGEGISVLSRGGALGRGSEIGSLTLSEVRAVSEASVREDGILARGGFIVEALRRFAPDLRLTPEQLAAPAVTERFAAREAPRARLRIPADMRYFQVAACLVQRQPALATGVVMRPYQAPENRLAIARMIDRARDCVGGARQVGFDPIQFRIYLADALYRWTVAARGVETLIPDRG